MKKSIIIVFIFCGLFLNAQTITMQKDSVWQNVGFGWRFVKVFNNYVIAPVPILKDSVIYTFNKLPIEIEERLVNEYSEIYGDTLRSFTKRIKVDLTYSRRLILYQHYINKVLVATEKTEDDKMFLYLKKAKEMTLSNANFYNYDGVQKIINPIEITKDTIK